MSQIEIECRILKRAGTKFALNKLIKIFFYNFDMIFKNFLVFFFQVRNYLEKYSNYSTRLIQRI